MRKMKETEEILDIKIKLFDELSECMDQYFQTNDAIEMQDLARKLVSIRGKITALDWVLGYKEEL